MDTPTHYVMCTLPVFGHMDTVATTIAGKGLDFKLREGFSAETSGMLRSMGVTIGV